MTNCLTSDDHFVDCCYNNVAWNTHKRTVKFLERKYNSIRCRMNSYKFATNEARLNNGKEWQRFRDLKYVEILSIFEFYFNRTWTTKWIRNVGLTSCHRTVCATLLSKDCQTNTHCKEVCACVSLSNEKKLLKCCMCSDIDGCRKEKIRKKVYIFFL